MEFGNSQINIFFKFQAEASLHPVRAYLHYQVSVGAAKASLGSPFCRRTKFNLTSGGLKRQGMATSANEGKKANRLLKERSYFLQHAYNPVDW